MNVHSSTACEMWPVAESLEMKKVSGLGPVIPPEALVVENTLR